jgi:NADPH-dependent 2,4-dienoyl-CoA reductase/sulfur reductase-like enzyme
MGMGLRTIPLFGGPRHHDLRRVCTPITINLLAAALLVGSVLLLPSYRYLLVVFKDEDRQQFAYSGQPTKGQPRIVILGGGFGGLAAARALSRELVRITLVDRRNHHLFQALLYQGPPPRLLQVTLHCRFGESCEAVGASASSWARLRQLT